MHTHIKIFKCNLLKCIEDCIEILNEMNTAESRGLVNQLYGIQPVLGALTESGYIDIMNQIYTHTFPLRTQIKNRDDSLFDSAVFQSLDVKTFLSIKCIVKNSKKSDVECMYEYIDSFIASCDRYRLENKEKLS